MKADGIGTAGAEPPTIRPKQGEHVPAPTGAPAVPDHSDIIPAAPPPSVLAEVAAAHQRAAELAREGRQLRFTADSRNGRIIVEVQDLEGRVLRRIPPSGALDVAGGDPLPE